MSDAQQPRRPDLAAELVRRAEVDQEVRGHFFPGELPTDTEIRRAREVDQDNTTWLETVVGEHGWPGSHLVGEHDAHKAWLLAQHADRWPKLQRHWLTLLRAAIQAGDADRETSPTWTIESPYMSGARNGTAPNRYATTGLFRSKTRPGSTSTGPTPGFLFLGATY